MNSIYNNVVKKLYSEPELYFGEFKDYKDDEFFWSCIVDQYKPKSILEVGIGNGRLAGLLHDMVSKYDGIDFSKEIVKYCKKNKKFDNTSFYYGDFKTKRLNKKYDLIILPFNVINHFYTYEDITSLFNNIRNHCKKNTIIIIDTINPTVNDLIDNENFVKTNSFIMNGQCIEVFENRKYDIINSTCIYTKRYVVDGTIINESVLPNRIFLHQELEMIIKSNRFKIEKIYGDYNLEDYKNNSRKQIYVIRSK
ncbi:MAG: class I SAM-dependent methyltransferase [Bacilli bacterium]|nr:class I SAM-dependent methyltransferase [Bacilli bacterium]